MTILPPLPGVDSKTFADAVEGNYYMRERPDLVEPPLVQLDGLYDVPWPTLNEAYGKAYFVPYYLEALSSPNEDDRDWGFQALWASVNHQGHPDSASPFVIPFLFRLVEAPNTPDRAGPLWLAVEMAAGDSRWCFEAGIDVADFHTTICEPMVAKENALLVRLLSNEDPAIRSAALRGCAFVSSCDELSLNSLLVLADSEPELGVRCLARIVVGIVSRRTGCDETKRQRQWTTAADFWEQASALVGLAYAAGVDLASDELRALDTIGQQVPTAFDEMELPPGIPIEREPAPKPPTPKPKYLDWDLGTTLRAQYVTASIPLSLDNKLKRAEEDEDEIALECARRAFVELISNRADEDAESVEMTPWSFQDLEDAQKRILIRIAQREVFFDRILSGSL